MSKEIWSSISYAGLYEVSNYGRVKSYHKSIRGKMLSPCNNGKGYLSVQLGGRRYYIHRLVMEAFVAYSTMEINHKDLNKANNHVSNLEYVTRRENQLHMIKNNRHNKAKLSADDRKIIKNMYAQGHTMTSLAKKFSVAKSTISAVVNGRTWNW